MCSVFLPSACGDDTTENCWRGVYSPQEAGVIMTKPKRILYRGVPMVEGWPEKIMAVQEIQSVKFKGRDISRIRYGKEKSDWAAASTPCHDCRVLEGEFHVPSCDVEKCPVCGGQLITCDCEFDDLAQVPE